MTALTRTDLSNHIRAMPPKSRGRRTLELFTKDMTTAELKAWTEKREDEEYVGYVADALAADFPPEVTHGEA